MLHILAIGMISSWKSEAARQVLEGRAPNGFPPDLVKAARRRLERLNAATRGGCGLRPAIGCTGWSETGPASGRSASTTGICFVWGAGGPEHVEIVDYH